MIELLKLVMMGLGAIVLFIGIIYAITFGGLIALALVGDWLDNRRK